MLGFECVAEVLSTVRFFFGKIMQDFSFFVFIFHILSLLCFKRGFVWTFYAIARFEVNRVYSDTFLSGLFQFIGLIITNVKSQFAECSKFSDR